MKTKFFTFSFLLWGLSVLQAQSSIHSSGGNFNGVNGSVYSSVGQAFYETLLSPSGSVSPGVQQTYQLTETLGVEITEINLSLKVYPNPTSDILYLKIGFNDYKKYHYDIFDGSGKILIGKSINESQTSIVMSSFPSAVYYLKVSKDGKVVKIFKVLKTDK